MLQLSTGMSDSSVNKVGPSADDTDRSTPESGPSALRQDTSDDAPTHMEEDDLLREDLVDYGATIEHSCMDVNVFHANQYVPSTLHQMLLQWVGDDVEQVHTDA
jgi:hypothetical protein